MPPSNLADMADGVLGNCFDDFRLARFLERGE